MSAYNTLRSLQGYILKANMLAAEIKYHPVGSCEHYVVCDKFLGIVAKYMAVRDYVKAELPFKFSQLQAFPRPDLPLPLLRHWRERDSLIADWHDEEEDI